jgi:hypothetical protein
VNRTLALISCLAGAAFTAFGQSGPSDPRLVGFTTVLPAQGVSNESIYSIVVTPGEIPMWNYTVTGYDGNVYVGALMGRNPNLRAKTTTNINLQVIPVKITITDVKYGAKLYDPTVADA